MILIIDALNAHLAEPILEDVYRLRARVFQDRLGWDVKVAYGQERDLFDDLHPAHVVSLDDDGRVVGCMRLLQTTGPHMLSDVFRDILDGEEPLRSPQLWEATRFCVDTDRLNKGRGRNSISYVTSEIMIGAFEYGMSAGVLDAVAVIDPIMDRVLKRSNNAPYDYLGSPKDMGKVIALAALMDCSEERVAGIRAFSGIEHDVFTDVDSAMATFTPHLPTSDKVVPLRRPGRPLEQRFADNPLGQYCREQLLNARSPEERRAAEALCRALAEMNEDLIA